MTMDELAALAGLSQTSVSLILNGKAGGKISRAKQEKVRELVIQYNYRPNAAARKLNNARQFTIGVMMPTPRNLFYADMVSYLQHKLAQRNYAALFSFWQSVDGVKDAFDAIFLHHNVDAIITWDYHECLENERIPIVTYDTIAKGFSSVMLDRKSMLEQSLDYLAGLGHRRIAYAGPDMDRRHEHLEMMMKDRKFDFYPEWHFVGKSDQLGGLKVIRDYLQMPPGRRPTALLVNSDVMAAGILYAARQNGISVPGDISMLAFNNNINAEHLFPPLTVCDCCTEKLADALVKLTMDKLGRPDMPEKVIYIKPKLVIRESCGAINNQ